MKGRVLAMNESCGWDITEMTFIQKICCKFTKTTLSRLEIFPESANAMTRVILWIVWHPLLLVVRFKDGAVEALRILQKIHSTSAIKSICGSRHSMFKETRFHNGDDLIGARVQAEGLSGDDGHI